MREKVTPRRRGATKRARKTPETHATIGSMAARAGRRRLRWRTVSRRALRQPREARTGGVDPLQRTEASMSPVEAMANKSRRENPSRAESTQSRDRGKVNVSEESFIAQPIGPGEESRSRGGAKTANELSPKDPWDKYAEPVVTLSAASPAVRMW